MPTFHETFDMVVDFWHLLPILLVGCEKELRDDRLGATEYSTETSLS